MRTLCVCAILAAATLGIAAPPAVRNNPKNAAASGPVGAYLQAPLSFEENRGQAGSGYSFVAHGPSYALGISSTGLALTLSHSVVEESRPRQNTSGLIPGAKETAYLQLRFGDSSDRRQLTGLDPQLGRSNYFIGNDPTRWRTDVRHFGRVRISALYPGIDLVLYGNQQQLEYDFDIAPGADPGKIQLLPDGAGGVSVDQEGNAILHTPAGDVELQRPVAYQEVAGDRRPVSSAFQLTKEHSLQFVLGEYDHRQPLVIDPILVYAVALGGSNWNQGLGLALDSQGDAYVSGMTCSADFPATAGKFSALPGNASHLHDCDSAFVVKLDPTASTLLYSDFIGSAQGFSAGGHLAVDSSGDAFVAGATDASDFPTVSNIGPSSPAPCGVRSSGDNCPVGFVFKLSPDGSQLLFSTLLGGGNLATFAFQTKLNPVTGDLVVLGETNTSSFTPAMTTLQTSFGGGSCYDSVACYDAFVVGLDPASGALRYGTFLGGAGNDWGSGLAFDSAGNIYVSGSTQPPFSASLGTATHTYAPAGGATASGTNLFVAKLLLSANNLSPGYLTLIEGDGDTSAAGIAIDPSGNLVFTGGTAAMHLPVTAGIFQSTNKETYGTACLWSKVASPFLPAACGTGLVGKLDPTGSLSFLTYLGGSGQDVVESVGLDSSGNLWLGGVTSSTDFPYSADHYTLSGVGGFSAPFLAEMSSDGTQLPFATQVGGSNALASDVFVDANNNVYVAGFAGTAPTTPGAYPPDPAIFAPAFVQKWMPGTAPSISVSTTGLDFLDTPQGGVSAPQTITIQNNGTTGAELGIALVSGYLGSQASDFLESTTCGDPLAGGASCTITVAFAPGPPSAYCVALPGCVPASRSAMIQITSNAVQGSQMVTLGGNAATGASLVVSPNPITFPDQAAGSSSSALYISGENAGDAGLLVSNIVLSGPNASDFQLTLTGAGGLACISGTVPPGSYCSLDLTFSPSASATGTRTATLTFTDSAGDSPQTVAVSGTVAGANDLIVSPLTLSPTFPVAIGTSQTADLTLQNPTANSIQITSFAVSGTNQGDFTLAPSSCLTGGNPTLPITVPANGTCYASMTFNPAAGASGTRTATLTVGTSPAISGLPTIALQGDAVTNSQPGMSFFQVPSPLNFGALQVGETSNAASVLLTINNNAPIPCAGGASSCGGPLTINSMTPGLTDYTVTAEAQSGGCTPFPATIATGSNCTYAIVFKPTAAGSRNTTLTIQSNDPQGTVQLPIYGSGLTLPLGEFLQTALNFGNSAIGVASPPLTTTLQNAGLSNLTISSVTASANFAVSADNCSGSPLAPNATCTVSATFTPPAAGPYTGTLTINDNGGFSQQQTVTLTGTGATGPQLRITPPLASFANQNLNTTSAPLAVTLTSTGDSNVTFPANAISTSQDFILQSSTCAGALAPGSSCTANIQFKPTDAALVGFPESGTMLVTDNVTGSPQLVYLQGTSAQGTTAASTTTLTSSQNPSTPGQSVIFTATVTGPSGNTTVPTGTVNFLDGSATLGSGTLNTSGLATYTTSSLSAGSHSITASYSGDGNFAGSTSSVLTQTVSSPSFSIGINQNSITVNAGSKGTATITVTPSGGFSQQVTFACTGLPAASTCSFSPSSVTPSGGNAATSTLTVDTNVASAEIHPPRPMRRSGEPETLGTLLAILFGMGGLLRIRRKATNLFCAVMIAGLAALFIAACGGGGGSGSSGGNGGNGGGGGSSTTPAGTSTVTVTATGGGVSQTATLTLVVQ